MPLHVSVVTPEREVWSGEAGFVVARSEGGEIGVLPGHAPFLGALKHSFVKIVHEEGGITLFIAVHGGFIEVYEDRVTVLARAAEPAEEIDVEAARAAKERAEQALRDWPMEALKAQAVASRTYVLWEMQHGHWTRFGYDVCATTTCQVYQGADAERGPDGRRWLRAVQQTSGQVLLYGGQPALARYHSSSGGRTLANEVVFPSDGQRPYLRGVADPADGVSPLHHWTVRFPAADM